MAKHKELWFSEENDRIRDSKSSISRIVTLRLKRDHKKQKRIQTAISWDNIVKLKELFSVY